MNSISQCKPFHSQRQRAILYASNNFLHSSCHTIPATFSCCKSCMQTATLKCTKLSPCLLLVQSNKQNCALALNTGSGLVVSSNITKKRGNELHHFVYKSEVSENCCRRLSRVFPAAEGAKVTGLPLLENYILNFNVYLINSCAFSADLFGRSFS